MFESNLEVGHESHIKELRGDYEKKMTYTNLVSI